MTALCAALLLVVVPSASRRVRTAAIVGAVAVTALVGASRVYLGVHWLTDVLGGLTLSTALACLLAAALIGRSTGREDEAGTSVLAPADLTQENATTARTRAGGP